MQALQYMSFQRLVLSFLIMSSVAASIPVARATTPAAVSATKVFAARTALDEHATTGEFKRRESAWRNWVSSEGMFMILQIEFGRNVDEYLTPNFCSLRLTSLCLSFFRYFALQTRTPSFQPKRIVTTCLLPMLARGRIGV